jgi:hypothetical protein
MELIESIACYSGSIRSKIRRVLTDEVKSIIVTLVHNPSFVSSVDIDLLKELIDMDVFKYTDDQLMPNTAIFFEEDMQLIKKSVEEMSERIADITKENASGLESCAPDVKNFIGCIMVGQELHSVLKERGLVSAWYKKTGAYERSKEDFNQSCEVYQSFGDDLQNKSVDRGDKFTSVTIGFGDNNYLSYLFNARNNTNKNVDIFYKKLAFGFIDLIPLLINGQIQNEPLKDAARIANINVDSQTTCITTKDAEQYKIIIDKVSNKCSDYYIANMARIQDLLSNTIVGRQGAPIENLMMNFWRYMRKMISRKLYDNGFLTDNIPQNGSATIFFENSINYF